MIQRTLTSVHRLIGARSFVPVVMACALLIRLAWIIWMHAAGMEQTSDAEWYVERALSIARGNGYAIDGVPTAYWPVGYPGFLGIIFSLFGEYPFAAMLVNVLLQGGALLLALLVARGLFASESIARITLLLLALHPNGIAYSSLLMSENLFLPLMLLGTLLMLKGRERWSWGIAAGIIYGLAALVKPQALLLPVITIAALWLSDRKRKNLKGSWKLAIAVNALMVLTVLPWTLRNHGLYGEHGIISNNDGVNLWIGNNHKSIGVYSPPYIPKQSFHQPHFNEYVENMSARTMALTYIKSFPDLVAKTLPMKLWALYRADTEGFTLNLRGMNEASTSAGIVRVLKILSQIYWIALCAATALSLFLWWSKRLARRGIQMPWLPFAIVLYFTAIPLIYFGDGRFHAPVIPWIAMIAAAGIVGVMRNDEGRLESMR